MSEADAPGGSTPPDGTPSPAGAPSGSEQHAELERQISALAIAIVSSPTAELRRVVVRGLERLTELLRIDRATLYAYSAEDAAFHSLHHYARSGVASPPERLAGAGIPSVVSALKRGEVVRYGRLRDVPSDDRAGIEPFQFPSVLGLPYAVPGASGYLALSSLHEEWSWDEALVARLHDVAELLANASVREHRESRLSSREPAGSGLTQLIMNALGHDLRNPLSAISGLTQLVSAKEDLPADVARRVAAIGDAARRIDALITTLLDVGAIHLEGTLPIVRAPMDFRDVCLRSMLAVQAARPTATITFDDGGSVLGQWDSARIARLVTELLDHGLNRSAAEPSVQLRLRSSEREVVLSVTDAGSVIPPFELRRMFEPLSGERDDSAGPTPAAVLRLFVVREIVRSHGGTLEARSSRDDGTRFEARMPLSGS